MKMFVSFKEYETEQGKLVIDELVEGAEAMILGEDGELTPAADGEYETEDGKLVIADGKITAIEVESEPESIEEPETPAEEVTEEPTVEEPKEEEEAPTEEPKAATIEEANRVIEEKDAKIAELEARIAELEAELAKPVADPLEMKAVVKETKTAKSGALRYFEA